MYGTDMCAQLQVPVRFGQAFRWEEMTAKDCTVRPVATAFRREKKAVI